VMAAMWDRGTTWMPSQPRAPRRGHRGPRAHDHGHDRALWERSPTPRTRRRSGPAARLGPARRVAADGRPAAGPPAPPGAAYVRSQTTLGGEARYRRLPLHIRSVRMVAEVHHPVALLNAAAGDRRALRDVATTVLMLPRLGGARCDRRSGRSRGVRCPPHGYLLGRRNRPTLTVPPTSGRARWAGGHKGRPSSTILWGKP